MFLNSKCWLLSELPCCAPAQLKLKNEHGNDIFDGEGFLLQQSHNVLQAAVLIKEEGPKTRVRTFLTSLLSNQILGRTLIPGRDFKQFLRNVLEGKQGVLTLVWVYDTIT